MKLIILRENLKAGLSAVERAVVENNNLPILKNVYLHADSRVQIITTNLELGITYYTAAKITENGGITVPFSTLYSIISNSDSERINLTAEKNILIVKTDNYEAKIQGIDESEFPLVPKIENNEHGIEIDSEILKDAINEIITSVQISEIKPELSGILFDFQVGSLKLVGTDSYRLAEKTLSATAFKTTLNKGLKIIIPLRTIQEVVRIIPQNQKIQIFIDPHQILFKTENIQIISRLIDGSYPDYAAIIPKSLESEVTVAKENILTGVKLVSNFSGKTSEVRLKAPKEGKTLEVYSNSQYLGENNYLIPIKKKTNGFEEISFNWRYLSDSIRSIPAEQVILGVNGDDKPVVIKPVGDTSLFYIVMPIKSS